MGIPVNFPKLLEELISLLAGLKIDTFQQVENGSAAGAITSETGSIKESLLWETWPESKSDFRQLTARLK